MGTIVNTGDLKRVVESNIQKYIEQVTGPYARLIAKSPTFVTYYSQNLVTSTVDTNLGGAIDLVGPESPLKFFAIRNFPLYGISEADMASQYDEEQGIITGSIAGEAILLPGNFDPIENDFFIISYLEARVVFRVKEVSADRIEGNAFYKVSYLLEPVEADDLESQVDTRGEFVVQNVGTSLAPIVASDVMLAVAELDEVTKHLRRAYWRAFYEPTANTVVLRGQAELDIHDRGLNAFLRSTGVLSSREYLGAKALADPDYGDLGVFEDTIYPRTIYGWAETGGDPGRNFLSAVITMPARPSSAGSPFFAKYALSGYLEAEPASALAPGVVTDWEFLTANDPSVTGLRSLALDSIHRALSPTAEDIIALTARLNDQTILTDRADLYWLLPVVLHEAGRLVTASQRTVS